MKKTRYILALFFMVIMINGCIMYTGGLPSELERPPVVYYSNAPFNPGYAWQYWYTIPAQPGFVFFFGNDRRHHRHRR